MLKVHAIVVALLMPLLVVGCGPSLESEEDTSPASTESLASDSPADAVEIGEVEGQLFGNCHTNNEDRGRGDLYETGAARNAIALRWVSPFGLNGGNILIYYKKAWAFRGKKDGEPLVFNSNGMESGEVVIRGLDRNDCYKFAAYQTVLGGSGQEVLLGITKAKTTRR